MKKNKKAFTLIELLVVIAIIGILATISVLALSNARAKSRDAKRAGDMKQVQTALELFFNDKGRYPSAAEWNTGQIYSTSTDATSTYMQVIPTAPVPADGNCTSGQNDVYYNPSMDGSTYTISFCLGNTTGTLTSGPKCLTPSGIVDTDCGRVGDDFSCPGLPVVQYDGGPYDDSGLVRNQGGYYRTVLINGVCWLRDSLNVGTPLCTTGATCALEPDNTFSLSAVEKYCNLNSEEKCLQHGALYPWTEVMGLPIHCKSGGYTCTAGNCVHAAYADCNYPDPTTTPRRGICPDGWHISTDTEWSGLETYLTNSGNTCNPIRYGTDCDSAGAKLSLASIGGTNTSGFSASGGGGRGGIGFEYWGVDSDLEVWTANFAPAPYGNHSIIRKLWVPLVYRDWEGRNYGFSARCVKD